MQSMLKEWFGSKGSAEKAGERLERTGLDGPDDFASEKNARNEATRFGLVGFDIIPVIRDIGTPTNLAEVGL